MFGRKKDENLLQELAELGRQIQKSVEAAANSDELKELGESLKKVGAKASEALKAAKASDEAKELGDQFKKVAAATAVKGKEAGAKAYENASQALAELGPKMSKLAEKLKERYKK